MTASKKLLYAVIAGSVVSTCLGIWTLHLNTSPFSPDSEFYRGLATSPRALISTIDPSSGYGWFRLPGYLPQAVFNFLLGSHLGWGAYRFVMILIFMSAIYFFLVRSDVVDRLKSTRESSDSFWRVRLNAATVAFVGTIGSTTIAMHFGDSYVSATTIFLISLVLLFSYFGFCEERETRAYIFLIAIGFCCFTIFLTYQIAPIVCVTPVIFAIFPKKRSLKNSSIVAIKRGLFLVLGVAISATFWEFSGLIIHVDGSVRNSISTLLNATNDVGNLHDKTIAWLVYKPDLAFPFVVSILAVLITAIPDFSRRFERSAFRFSSVSLICAVATMTWLEISPRVAQGLQLEMQHYYGWLWPFALFFLCLVLHTVGKRIAPRFNYLLLAGTLLLLIVVNLNARSDFQFYVPRIVFNTFTALLVVGLAAILLIRLLSESSDDRSKTIWHSLIILLLPLFLFLPETTSSTIPLRPIYKFEYQLIGPGPARNRPAGEAVAVRSLNYATDRVSLETQAFTEVISVVRNTSLVIVSSPYANAAIDSTVAMFIVPINRSIVWKDAQQSPSEVRRALENPEKKKASVVVFANDLVTAEDRFNSLAIPEPTVERYVCGHRSSSAGSIAYCAAVLTDG